MGARVPHGFNGGWSDVFGLLIHSPIQAHNQAEKQPHG